MKVLTENVFTDLGTEQFVEHTKLMTVSVKEVIAKSNPSVKLNETVFEALSRMTDAGLGAVTVIKEDGALAGIFTDGDLRRSLGSFGKSLLEKPMGDLVSDKMPITITSDALLYEAVKVFKETGVDNIIVLENNMPVGMIDIQDFVKMNLVG
jgi:CBS domain-containing protein